MSSNRTLLGYLFAFMDKQRLKIALKRALSTDAWRNKSNVKEWLIQTIEEQLLRKSIDRLEGLAAWGIVDKSRLSDRALKAVDLHYVQGRPIKEIASVYGVPEYVIANDINGVLDFIIAHAPKSILASLNPSAFPKWLIGGCPHCKALGFTDSLWWDESKDGKFEGAWVGFMCSRRYDADLNPIGKD